MTTRILKIVILLIVICGVVGVVWYVFFYRAQKNPAVTYSSSNTPYAVLEKTNPTFAQADAAFNAGQYDTAQQLFEQALTQAQDVVQKGQIQFKLASIESAQGHTIQAVDEYKAIVANHDYDNYRILKAYAIQDMAELYYNNGDQSVTAEIFKDAPYAQMEVQGDLALSYRNLEQYATSFYPLALPELRVAQWYAEHANATSTPDSEATSTYPALIKNSVNLANADINRIRTDVNAAKEIPDILVRKEALYVLMYENGLASAQDTEQACKDALNMYASIGLSGKDGMARYYYAVFLSELGLSRVGDLQSVLAPFYTTQVYVGSYPFSFFASEKSNALSQKARLVKLATLDPKFKALLVSLGWKTADF